MPSSGAPHFRDPRPLVVFLCSPAAELNNRPLVQYSQRGFIQISGLREMSQIILFLPDAPSVPQYRVSPAAADPNGSPSSWWRKSRSRYTMEPSLIGFRPNMRPKTNLAP